MVNSLTDLDRRKLSFVEPRIKEALPEHFISEYPNLILFLEKYYQFLDSDQDVDFTQTLKNLLSTRDILETDIPNLDLILNEVGMGTTTSGYFRNPRYAARLFGEFYRAKGSLYSAEAFFRAFYNTNATVEYPKRNVFVIDQSLIGPEDLALIQDGALYQTLSILIKSEIPLSVWENLYKQFVHPAGFYLGSQVVITSVANLGADIAPSADLSEVVAAAFADVGILTTSPMTEITSLVRIDNTNTYVRTNPAETISVFKDVTVGGMVGMYSTIQSIIDVASSQFDATDSDSAPGMDMSNRIETVDQNKYQWWDSDSDGYALQLA